jgi:hypothetical protein
MHRFGGKNCSGATSTKLKCLSRGICPIFPCPLESGLCVKTASGNRAKSF